MVGLEIPTENESHGLQGGGSLFHSKVLRNLFFLISWFLALSRVYSWFCTQIIPGGLGGHMGYQELYTGQLYKASA